MQAAECHLIIIKNDLQSYSSLKDIISVKLIVKASKNNKIQQKHKIHAQMHRGALTEPQHLEGCCWKREGDLFLEVAVFK